MSAGITPFGALPQFADLSPDDLAALMQRVQGAQAQAQAPGSPDQLLFNRTGMGGQGGFQPQDGADPQTTGAVPPQALPQPMPRVSGMNPSPLPPAVAMNEADTQRLERQMASPADAAAMGMPQRSMQPGPAMGQQGALPAQPPAAQIDAPAPAPQPGAMQQFLGKTGLGGVLDANPDLLTSLGIGLLTKRGIGAGIGAGLQANQEAQQRQAVTDLARFKLGQTVQGQNATRQYLIGKGMSAQAADAAMLNPTVLSSLLTQMNQKTPEQIQAESQASAAGTRLGGQQLPDKVAEADALAGVKDKHEKDDVVILKDANGANIAVRKSSLFPTAKGDAEPAPGAAGNIMPITEGKPDQKANEGLDKLIGENLTGGYQKAQGAVGTLAAISRQKEALDKGIFSGAGADWRTKAQAIAAQYLGLDASALNDSQAFDAASTQKQAELAKAVSQAGHTTNMDLQLGKTIAGGDRSKTEQALRQIVDAQETLARDAIDRHNASLDRYSKIAPDAASRVGFFRVDTPDVYKYGQGTPNPLADPGARLPTGAPTPLDVGGSRPFAGGMIRRIR